MQTDLPTFPFTVTTGDAMDGCPHGTAGLPPVGQVRLPTGQVAWLVTRHADVRTLLRSPWFSSDPASPGYPLLRPLSPDAPTPLPGVFLQMDAPEHPRYRRLLAAEFGPRTLRRLEPLIDDTVRGALANLRGAGPGADLVEHVAFPVPSTVISHLLGVPYADHPFFQYWGNTLVDTTAPQDAVDAAWTRIHDYLAGLVERRLREAADEGAGDTEADDLISRLAREQVATGQLGVEDLVGACILLLVAGFETTAGMIGAGVRELLLRPGLWQTLCDRPELIDGAVEELLRYLTVLRTGLGRVATADVEIGGQLIRTGEGVIALLTTANRDPGVFDDPDTLEITRDANGHFAFGYGLHQCIGAPLARIELRAVLRELTMHVPGLALVDPTAPARYHANTIVFGLTHLPVTWPA
jgi:pentalenic acid synthase